MKKTVNQDDVSAYHLFYADGLASPGTDITFFDWPVGRERRGTHSVVRTGLRVASAASLAWWEKRFADLGVASGKIVQRDGRASLDFEDFEGQRLSLVVDATGGAAHPWEKSPVPAEHQIRGLGPITISVPDVRPTEAVLTKVMGMQHVREYAIATDGPVGVERDVEVYQMGAGGPQGRQRRRTVRASPRTSRWRRWARSSRCRRFSSRGGRRLNEGSSRWKRLEKLQAPRSKLQGNTRSQTPTRRPLSLGFAVWIFSGAWCLDLGSFIPPAPAARSGRGCSARGRSVRRGP